MRKNDKQILKFGVSPLSDSALTTSSPTTPSVPTSYKQPFVYKPVYDNRPLQGILVILLMISAAVVLTACLIETKGRLVNGQRAIGYIGIGYTCIVSVVSAMFGFGLTYAMIPHYWDTLTIKGLWGIDLNKVDGKRIPEALGIVVAGVYIICTIICQVAFTKDPFRLLEYNAGLLSIALMTFLGFADDVLDLRWRYKLMFPILASVPMVFAYSGPTTVLLPVINRLVDLNIFFYVYISVLTLICANSINIYAGINGLEVGQAIIISAAVVTFNLFELLRANGMLVIADLPVVNEEANLLSLLFTMPFLGTSLGLLYYNWYPSLVFVGDVYTHFAGVSFAAIGVLGHNSKTLLLFFVPQIVNLFLSFPQLLKIVPCPRHRVPKLDKDTGKLKSSHNLTVINLCLEVFGEMSEHDLVRLLLLLQILTCTLGLCIRYSQLLGSFFV